jgi:Tfp pilus assembly protein PilP
MNLKRYKWKILAPLFVVLTFCIFILINPKKRLTDLEQYVQIVRNNNVAVEDGKLQNIWNPKPFIYTADKTKSPFGSIKVENETSKSNEDLHNPLLNYSINTLRFIGYLEDGQEMAGFIKAPDNMVYEVQVGDIISLIHAKIILISKEKIDVQFSEPGAGSNMAMSLMLKDQQE